MPISELSLSEVLLLKSVVSAYGLTCPMDQLEEVDELIFKLSEVANG